MHPCHTVFRYVNVSFPDITITSPGFLVLRYRQRAVPGFPHILILILVLIALSFGMSIAIVAQTTIVARRTPIDIVVGADSLECDVTITKDAEGKETMIATPGTKCKIRQVGGTFFAIAGRYDFDADSLAETSCEKGHILAERADIFTENVDAPLKKMLEKYRGTNYYQTYFGPARSTLEIIFFGIENGTPAYVWRNFFTEPLSPGRPVELYLGRNEAIRDFNPTVKFWRPIGSIKGVQRLIKLEIRSAGEEVGPPIDILRVTRSGVEWICQKPKCDKEQKKGVSCDGGSKALPATSPSLRKHRRRV
jgi:hypothetical protein